MMHRQKVLGLVAASVRHAENGITSCDCERFRDAGDILRVGLCVYVCVHIIRFG